MNSCDPCLKRAALLGLLAPRICDLRRGLSDETKLLLALPDHNLIRAVGGSRSGAILAEFEAIDPGEVRARAEHAGLVPVCRHDAAYPGQLLELEDAPGTLFVRGDPTSLLMAAASKSVAIVGGRRPSTYALEVAGELGRSLAVAGVPVVSGLALGVDGAAHRGALRGGGRPVAILASGADVPYPAQHRQLYAQVVEAGGSVVSEMPPGTRPWKWAFPARNRIMAGLADMVVVVEAGEPSGTLITARFAYQLGRELGAVPGRINARLSAGSNRLLADGAVVVLGVQDILDRLFGAGGRRAEPAVRVKLSSAEARVLDVVESGDSPVAAHDVDVKQVRAALGRLEALGLVRRDGLEGYERTGMQCVRA